jgi:hypothetical protein
MQIPQHVEYDLGDAVREVTIRLDHFHVAKHHALHTVEHASQSHVGQHAIKPIQPFAAVFEKQNRAACLGLKWRAQCTDHERQASP